MINFHNVRWKNFLSTGNVWTDIQLDRSPNTLVIGENGAGKSTMLDALCYALFAKPFRKINKPQLRNSVNLKDTLVEVTFTIGNSSYKIVRGMSPNIFEIYKDDRLLNQTASARDYQTYLEQNILKLNYNSFTQIVILGSSSFVPFMQLPTGARREIIEDLLDIKIFTAMNLLLKEKIQTNKDELKEVKMQTGLEQEKLEVHQKFIDDIRSKNKERIDSLKNEVLVSEGAIDMLEADIEEYNNEAAELQGSITDEHDVNNKLNEIRKIESKLEDRKKKFKKDIKFYQDNDTCPTCDQDISQDIKSTKINESEDKLAEIVDAMDKLGEQLEKENSRLLDIFEINSQIQELNTNITDRNNQVSSLNKYISNIRKQIDAEVTQTSDLKSENALVKKIKKKIESLENKREEHITEKELLDIASELLKDKGIKTQIVRQYIPVMNKLVNKYLASMEFFVSFELDENFNEMIKSRHRDKFSYASFSEGEKMRIDLSLLLTWRAIAKMKNSTNTNLLILDEVFDASLDNNGSEEFLKLLDDLSSKTNVFVISHKGDVLQDKFRSVIRFEKHKNFSRIAA
jgi:DNA repair exonuclease SbcCD ATPase subunit